MTLDLTKIVSELRRAVAVAVAHAQSGADEFVDLLRRLDDAQVLQRVKEARTSWLLAVALERYFARYSVPEPHPLNYSCVATDGSIVASDRHGPLHYAIVNIGYCVLEYGPHPQARLGAEPTVLCKDEDLWITDGARRIPVTGAALAARRAVMELETGLRLCGDCTLPVVVLQDGTLIPWGLEGQTGPVVAWALERFATVLQEYRQRKIPVAGVISYPGSRDVVNVLRVAACDYPQLGRAVDCDDCLARVQRGERHQACRIVPDVTDRWLFGRFEGIQLSPGERSACYRSRSTILRQLPEEDQIVFFYLHTGSEIARVEIPLWIAADQRLLEVIHGIIWDQCCRARGYPLALQEAHEQAVVHREERLQIEAIVDQLFADAGLIQERSAKERSKRVRFA